MKIMSDDKSTLQNSLIKHHHDHARLLENPLPGKKPQPNHLLAQKKIKPVLIVENSIEEDVGEYEL